MSKDKLDFQPIDPSDLSAECKKLFQTRAKLADEAKKAEDAFEAAFVRDHGHIVPANKTIVFGYRYGGLAVGFPDAKTAKKKPTLNIKKIKL